VTEFTITGLRVVDAVATAGSFTRAAERLGYTQSAVSRQVALMEAAAGTVIFDRGRRGAALTSAGQVLVRRARQVLADLAATEVELARLRDRLAGRLAVGTYPAGALALVPTAMARLAVEHPGLAVRLDEASTPALLRRLRAGRLDLAVIGVGQDLPEYDLRGLEQTPVGRSDLLVAVSAAHPFADRASVRVAELARERWIVGEGARGEPQFGAWPTLTAPDVAHAVRSWGARLGLVAAGLGITVLPEVAAPALPAGVRALPVVDSAWNGRTTLAVTAPDPSPQVDAMVQALRGGEAPHPG
jgi:DNA-binding transcriptional LysR family regulator